VVPRVIVAVELAPYCSVNESVPSKPVNDTECTSLKVDGALVTNAVTSVWVRWLKYGSVCGWRSSEAQMPA
jgi:hypothetical protein